ncbi:MAG: hypothetical protein PUB32_07720 [Clostridiales bacterium]|nr:hypothetical protein [Clostridiales bacterium]
MKKLSVFIFAAFAALLLAGCGGEVQTEKEELTFTQMVSREEETFRSLPIKELAAQSDWVAMVEIASVTALREQEFTVSIPKGEEQWSAYMHVIEAKVINSLKGAEEGQSLSIPLAVKYSREESEIKTAYWKVWYHGARYKPGERLIIIGTQAAWETPNAEETEPKLLYIGDGDGNAFYSSGTMRRITEQTKTD